MPALPPRTPHIAAQIVKERISLAPRRGVEREHTHLIDIVIASGRSRGGQEIHGWKKLNKPSLAGVSPFPLRVGRKKRVEPSQSSARWDDTAKMGATTYNFVSRIWLHPPNRPVVRRVLRTS